MNTPPVILAIAGSDPSGGAGIQADIKTVSALGGYAAAAVTAITVQNTRGVAQVEYLSPETVGRQCGAVIEDLSPDAVKIGMTGTPAIISAIAEVLERYGCRNVVFDPVALSTSGKILTQPDALETACNRLFPLCRVVTPNLPEASLLTGEPITDEEEMRRAARLLHERYGCAFLIKGGHLDADRPTDILYDGRMYAYTADRIETSNLHGTGCTLSSAIATLLGRGLPLETAVGRHRSRTHPANRPGQRPALALPRQDRRHAMKLIVITSPEFLPGETELMQAMLEEGLDRIHLRKPGCTAAELAALIERFPAPFRPRITLHDHFPLQRTYGLGGVHLNGRNPDLPDGYRGTVSRSCHSLEEVATHRTATDYLFLSPVFDSISKQGYRSAFPPAALREAAAAGIIDEKVLALGGVSEANLPEVRDYGFGGAALLGDIWARFRSPADTAEVLRHFRHLLQAAR